MCVCVCMNGMNIYIHSINPNNNLSVRDYGPHFRDKETARGKDTCSKPKNQLLFKIKLKPPNVCLRPATIHHLLI